jgi:hypothetical protein
MDQNDTEHRLEAMKFFQGERGERNEIFANLRDSSEKAAYLVETSDIPIGNDVAESIASYAEGISRASGKPQADIEKQIRKYLQERSWARQDGREPE